MENPESRCITPCQSICPLFFSCVSSLLTLLLVVLCVVKQRPRLKSRYKQRVEAAIEYASKIEDFNNLVNPWTLVLHCLGPEPFASVLQTIEIEEKKSKC